MLTENGIAQWRSDRPRQELIGTSYDRSNFIRHWTRGEYLRLLKNIALRTYQAAREVR